MEQIPERSDQCICISADSTGIITSQFDHMFAYQDSILTLRENLHLMGTDQVVHLIDGATMTRGV
jgi:hypothetical protein